MMTQKYYIGVDISKEKLDFALVSEGKLITHKQIGNDLKEIKNLFKEWFKVYDFSQKEGLVCMEHTGVYCNRLIEYLEKSKWDFCLESALNIKYSQGMKRGKNDKIDAERIAIYAWKNRDSIQYYKVPKGIMKVLKNLYSLRRNLIKSKVAIETSVRESSAFLDKKTADLMKEGCSKSIQALNSDIEKIEMKIMDLIRSDSQLSHQFDIVTSVPGIKFVTGTEIIITTGGFTNFTCPKKYACLAGVVPFEHTSGKSVKGKSKVSKMSNKSIKTLLHLAARSLINSKSDLGDFYRRKIAEGKNSMNVLTAMGKKLIDRVFACIKEDRFYQKDYSKIIA